LDKPTLQELLKVGLGSSKGPGQLVQILNMLPASFDAIKVETGLANSSVRRYFTIARKLKINIVMDKNSGNYYVEHN